MIDFIFIGWLNKQMLNSHRGYKIIQSIHPVSKTGVVTNSPSRDGYINSLMKRLKRKEQKEKKEKLFFLMTAISALVISGIIVSF